MKISIPSIALSLASLFTSAIADVNLNPFPGFTANGQTASVTAGQTYTVSWTATQNYTHTLWLVLSTADDLSNSYAWEKISSLAVDLVFPTLQGSYTWTIPSNTTLDGPYALWLDSFVIPFDGESYSSMTDWFEVTLLSNSTIPSSSATSTPTSTAFATGGSGLGGSATSSASVATSVSDHKDLSGAAIAGIVIAVLATVAMAIGATLLFIRRRKRKAIKDREAEARAGRLEPVMQEHYPGYEMKNRSPGAVSEEVIYDT